MGKPKQVGFNQNGLTHYQYNVNKDYALGSAGHGKSGGIWASSAQKDLRLQKDYANSN